jgi:chromosome segregation ATPase
LTGNAIDRMNEVPFKNLASAKEEYIKLSEEFASVKEKLTQFDALEADNSELKTQLEIAQKSVMDGTAQIAFRDEALSAKDTLIVAKDDEIKQLKADIDLLNVKCRDLERTQKSVKTQARELVAASAGAPAAVDNSEMEMTETDIAKAMRQEFDPQKLNALYRQLKAQRAANK